jgi:hypothetical protein
MSKDFPAKSWAPSQRRRERFWSSVDIRAPDECWPWKGTRLTAGYGSAAVDRWRSTAHRIAFAMVNGRPDPDLCVKHSCDNPPCCNPGHLSADTQAGNLADMRARGRAGDCRVLGEAHGMAKFTDEQVRQVREMRTRPMSQQAIADTLGIAQTHVSRIIRGVSRK